MHKMPTMLRVGELELQGMFAGDYDLSLTVMNGIVRLYQEMDDQMYGRWSEKRWRHFLPVDFAVQIIEYTVKY